MNNKEVQGKIKINGETYTAICDCNPTTPEATKNKKLVSGPLICDPKKMNIKKSGKPPFFFMLEGKVQRRWNHKKLFYKSSPSKKGKTF